MNKQSSFVFLSTNELSKAGEICNTAYGFAISGKDGIGMTHHLYILSEEKDDIKKGDYVYNKVHGVFQMEGNYDKVNILNRQKREWWKIIATTNPELHTKPIHREGKPDYIHEGTLSISQSDIEYIISLYNSKSKSVDVEDLALGYVGTKPEVMDEREIGKLHGFIDGYNQCLQDNSDKKFTEQQMIDFGLGVRNSDGTKTVNELFQDFKKHYGIINKEQPKRDTVMVEYEHIEAMGYIKSGWVPKLDKDGNIVIVRT